MQLVKIFAMMVFIAAMAMPAMAQQNKVDKKTPAQSETVKKQVNEAKDATPVKAKADQKVKSQDSATAKKAPEKPMGVKKYRGEVQRMEGHKMQISDYNEDVERKRREIDRMGIEKIQRQTRMENIGETEKDATKKPEAAEKKSKEVRKKVETKKR